MLSIVLAVQSLIIFGLFAFVLISDLISINYSAFTKRIRLNKLRKERANKNGNIS